MVLARSGDYEIFSQAAPRTLASLLHSARKVILATKKSVFASHVSSLKVIDQQLNNESTTLFGTRPNHASHRHVIFS